MKKISILGCGWLGFPLAENLCKKGFSVKGSTTTINRLPEIDKAGIFPYLISLGTSTISGEIDLFLEDSEILILSIPPKLRNPESDDFDSKIGQLIPFIEKSEVKKVLFISSISVYSDAVIDVSEAVFPNPESQSGKQLLASEQLLQKNENFKTTVLRFGGLVGGERHPVFSLSGKENLKTPKAVINLIHRDDCIGIIERIILSERWNETFNAVTPFHPTREEYYTKKAIELGLRPPQFNQQDGNSGKVISSQKIQQDLQYVFQKTATI